MIAVASALVASVACACQIRTINCFSLRPDRPIVEQRRWVMRKLPSAVQRRRSELPEQGAEQQHHRAAPATHTSGRGRRLLPAEAVDLVVEHWPEHCRCGHRFDERGATRWESRPA